MIYFGSQEVELKGKIDLSLQSLLVTNASKQTPILNLHFMDLETTFSRQSFFLNSALSCDEEALRKRRVLQSPPGKGYWFASLY